MAARKTVTVVFSDIANYTPLGEALDPEVLRNVMEQYFSVVRRELLADRLFDVRRKGYRKPKPLTFGEYRKTWLEEGEARRGWSAGTVSAYKGVLDRNLGPYFDSMRLGSIRPRDVAAYIREQLKRYSPATVDLDVTVGHDICKVAVRDELLDSNPFAGAESG